MIYRYFMTFLLMTYSPQVIWNDWSIWSPEPSLGEMNRGRQCNGNLWNKSLRSLSEKNKTLQFSNVGGKEYARDIIDIIWDAFCSKICFPASSEGKIFQGLEMEDALQEIQRAVEAEFSEQQWFGGPSHMLCVEIMVCYYIYNLWVYDLWFM